MCHHLNRLVAVIYSNTCEQISLFASVDYLGSPVTNMLTSAWACLLFRILSTVQITFIFIGQTRLVVGKYVCTCVTKHSNAFQTFLNWLKNSKRVWHEPKLDISRLPLFANFDLICERLVGLVSFKTNVSETAGQIHLSDNVRCNGA